MLSSTATDTSDGFHASPVDFGKSTARPYGHGAFGWSDYDLCNPPKSTGELVDLPTHSTATDTSDGFHAAR